MAADLDGLFAMVTLADERAPVRNDRAAEPQAARGRARKGQAAKSPDLTAAVFLLGALGACTIGGPRFVLDATAVLRHGLIAVAEPELASGDAIAVLLATCATIAHLAWPFLVIPAAAAIGVQLLQTRFAVSWEGAEAPVSRVDPLEGARRGSSGPAAWSRGSRRRSSSRVLIYVAVVAVRGAWARSSTPGTARARLITVAGAS